MYRHLEQRLAESIARFLAQSYPGTTLPGVVIEQPPKVELGDFAIPIFPFRQALAQRSAKDCRSDSRGDRFD